MTTLDAPQVALEIGRRASLEGGNPYKATAYIRAAESLRTLVIPLDEVVRRSQLRAIPGVGDASPAASLNSGITGPMKRSTGSARSFPQACWSC
jgi:DNA polymerase/3'-5' exonuclease PolX